MFSFTFIQSIWEKNYALLQSLASPAKVLLQLMQRLTSGYVSMFQLYFIHESVWEQSSGDFTTYSHTDIFVLMNTLFPGCSPHSVLWHWLMCQHGCAVSGSDRFSRFHLSATCKTINPMLCSPTHLMPSCPVLACEVRCENLGNSSTSI